MVVMYVCFDLLSYDLLCRKFSFCKDSQSSHRITSSSEILINLTINHFWGNMVAQ